MKIVLPPTLRKRLPFMGIIPISTDFAFDIVDGELAPNTIDNVSGWFEVDGKLDYMPRNFEYVFEDIYFEVDGNGSLMPKE